MTEHWPTPQDYNEAIQSPKICFADPDLKNGTVTTNALGLPRSMTGAFASVYKISSAEKAWAVRCFLTNRRDQKDRYEHISNFVRFDHLDCTIDFHYLDEGIRVKGEWYPCLKMPWVDGLTMDQFLYANYKTPGAVKDLLQAFHEMVDELEGAGIGHGDLQHGNIIITKEGLRLVDYDALYVPALKGRKSLEFGHPNYQHPERTEDHYDPDVDNFSCWLIHASLLAVAIDPSLVDAFSGIDDCILFRRKDLACPEESNLFKHLLGHESHQIKEAASLIQRMLWAAPTAIPILDAPGEQLALLPQIRPEKGDLENADKQDIQQIVIESSFGFDQWQSGQLDEIDRETELVTLNAQKRKRKELLKRLSARFRSASRDMLDELHKQWSPSSWMLQNMLDAETALAHGEYETAHQNYLAAFHQLEHMQRTGSKEYFDCLMGLGYSSALSTNAAIAGNYFRLATKHINASDQFKMRAALCLAVTKYENSDHDTAMKVMGEYFRGDTLEPVLAEEIKHSYVLRSSTVHMLRKLAERHIDANDPERGQAALAASRRVLALVTNACIEPTEPAVYALLKLASFSFNKDKTEARLLLEEINNVVDGHSQNSELGILSSMCSAIHCRTQHDKYTHLSKLARDWKDRSPTTIRFVGFIDYLLKLFPGQDVAGMLFDLGESMLDEGLPAPAALTVERALKLSMANNFIPENLGRILSRMEIKDVSSCLSNTYLSQTTDTGLIVANLLDNNRAILLGRLLIELATNGDTELVGKVFDSVSKQANYKNIQDIEKVLSSTEQKLTRQQLSILTNASHQLSLALRSELDRIGSASSIAVTTDEASDEGFLALRALDNLRIVLEILDDGTEGQRVISAMSAQVISTLRIKWQSYCYHYKVFDRLTRLNIAFINSGHQQSVAEFLVSAIRSEKVSFKEIAAPLVVPAVSQENLRMILMPVLEASLHDLTDAKRSPSYLNLRTLFELKNLPDAAGMKNFFFFKFRPVLESSDAKTLAEWLAGLVGKNELSTLKELTISFAESDSDRFIAVCSELQNKSQSQTITEICKVLLHENRTEFLLNIASRVTDQALFGSLASAIIRLAPDSKTILDLAEFELQEKDRGFIPIIINELKLTANIEILLLLLPKVVSPAQEQPVSIESQHNLARRVDSTSDSEQLYLAAMADDRSLAKAVQGISDAKAIPASVDSAISRCKQALQELIRLHQAHGGTHSPISQMGVINITALHRLSRYDHTQRATSIILDNYHLSFFEQFVQERVQSSSPDCILALASQAARLEAGSMALSTIFLVLARQKQLRSIIVLAKIICDEGLAGSLTTVAKTLLENNLTDAFGAVSLEIVTSTCDNLTILNLAKAVSSCSSQGLRTIRKQVSFYRDPVTAKALETELNLTSLTT